MRLTTFLLTIFALCSYAADTHSQNARVTINKKVVQLDEVLNEIESQTDYLFIYNNNVGVNRRVSVKVKNKPVSYVLTNLLRNTDIDYSMEGTHIVLSKRAVIEPGVGQYARKIALTGHVVDSQGEPVIGANVLEKGVSNGTITGMDGEFSLTVGEEAVLQVSYIGYITQEIKIGAQTTLQITLIEDNLALDEVVVIGYGTSKKSDLVGAVSTLSSKKFDAEPVLRLDAALQGRVAGVQVTNLSGAIGSGAKIRIRGTTSLNKSSDPLYVVDGIIGADAYNMSDVESVEILKDASSTAIYGSRGANGVVLITTKKGRTGKPQVTFETNQGVSTLAKRYDVLDPYEYALALNDIKGTGTISDADLQQYKDGTLGIDWQDLVTQTGHTQDYFLTVTGGTNAINYLVSSEVLDQTGITVFSKYKRYQIRANLNSEVTKWFSLSTDLRLSRINSARTGANFALTTIYSPTMLLKNPNTGRYNLDPYNSIDGNPYAELADGDSDNFNNRVYGNAVALFTILDGLTLSIQGGFNYGNDLGYGFNSTQRSPSAINGMSNSTSNSLSWQNTNNLTYTKRFGDHSLTATAVWELTSGYSSSMGISGSGLLTETVTYWNVGLASTRDNSNGYSESSMASGLARVQYNYQGKYLASASIRADGSSHFQGDNKWGYFPTVGVGWNISEEDFMKDQHTFQRLKLRANAGVIGNQGIGSYETLGMMSGSNYAWGTSTWYTGYWAASVPTPNVKWEKTNQYDIGVEFGVLNNRLNVTLDWFLKDTKDLLNRKTIPDYNGGGSFWVNQGRVKNHGIDLLIDAIPIQTNDFVWETTLTGGYVKNKVVDMAGEEEILGAQVSGVATPSTILKLGYPVGSFYVFDWAGINKDTGKNMFRKADGTLTDDPASTDRIVTGQTDPSWTLGWNNTLSWKNFEFNAFFSAALGNKRLDLTRYQMTAIVGPSMFINLRDAYYKNWDVVSNKADAEYQSMKSPGQSYGNSTQYLEDASYLKLKNVSIAYNFPKRMTQFANVRLSLSAQNIFTLTKYKGYDPEIYNTTGSGTGIDWGAYPVPRSFTLGLRISF
ncbi:MAG: TonB-dependent receptor [Tannerellaceae bacterium]|nr:TonB-dependent receptor [Tannerellaceae bacterium]